MSPSSSSSGAQPSGAGQATVRAVITSTGALNGGDAAILYGQLATLRAAFPSLDVAIFDQQAEIANRYLPELDLRPALFWMRRPTSARFRNIRWGIRMVRLLAVAAAWQKWPRRTMRRMSPTPEDLHDLECYADADLILTPGGTMLVEQYQFLPRLFDHVAALTLRRRLVFFTQSLGPFRAGVSKQVLARVLRRAELVLVRGEESRRQALGLGVRPDRCRVTADAAFVLAKEYPVRHHARLESAPLRVALSLRDWPFFRTVAPEAGQHQYEQAVADLCTWLVRTHHAEVVCLSTCQGVPEYWMDDARPAQRMADTLPPDVRPHVTVDKDFHRPLELRDRFGEFDLTVATRLHAAILSLCAGTPVVAIEYERKAGETFAELGLPEWVVEIEQLEGERLIEVVGRLIDGLEAVRRDVAVSVAAQRSRALAVADDLRAAVLG